MIQMLIFQQVERLTQKVGKSVFMVITLYNVTQLSFYRVSFLSRVHPIIAVCIKRKTLDYQIYCQLTLWCIVFEQSYKNIK